MWALFQNMATVMGYFFASVLCIGVVASILYWVYKFGKIIVNKLKARSTKIKFNGYVYQVVYKYVEYDCFMFTAYKDWYFVIKRYPEYPLNCRFDKKFIKYLSIYDDHFSPYDYCKGYGLHKYKSLDEAKAKLQDYVKHINESQE